MFIYPLALILIGAIAYLGRENRLVIRSAGLLFALAFFGFSLQVGHAALDYARIQAAESVAQNAI